MIDRNQRARLLARMQADRSLTLGARAVGRAIVCLCDRSGRTVACYDRIARAAGVDRRTVSRALPRLWRYIAIHRRRAYLAGRNGGVVLANLVNVYDVTSLNPPKGQPATGSTIQIIPMGSGWTAWEKIKAARRLRELTSPPNPATLPGARGEDSACRS